MNNQHVTDIQIKSNLFNNYFSEQCRPIDNNSTVPINTNLLTQSRLSQLHFSVDDVTKVVQSLNPNKAHGHDGISIRMLQLCCPAISKPLYLLFRNSYNSCTFPNAWKKANVIPIHKKNDKQVISNYRPISLLPICSKIFERIIFNNLYKHLSDNELFSSNQSGFRSNDSCVHQLIKITHDIYKAFDTNPSLETRGIFLDLSKAFDRVWHEGLLYKLKNVGVEGNLFDLIYSFLSNRHQRVVLNGQESNWRLIQAGVPQGSILGPLFFLIYINDLPHELKTDAKLFADDTALFSIVQDSLQSASDLNNDLKKINDWAVKWKMEFNPDLNKPAQEIIFSRKLEKDEHPEVSYNNNPIKQMSSIKHLGLVLDEKLNFKSHIQGKISKAMTGVGLIRKLSSLLPRSSLLTIYKSFVRPHLDYGDVVFDQPNNQSLSDTIESVQYNAALAITGAIRGSSKIKLYQELGLEFLKERRWMRRLCYLYKIISLQKPTYLYSCLPTQTISRRYPNSFALFRCRTVFFENSFLPYSIKQWNALSPVIREYKTYAIFCKSLLNFIKPMANSIFNIYDATGVKLLTRLRLGFSHLNEHKFRHNFQETLNPMCSCMAEAETTCHFLLRCCNFTNIRMSLMNDLSHIDNSFTLLTENKLVDLLLFGCDKYDSLTNRIILNLTISFIKESKRFEGALF